MVSFQVATLKTDLVEDLGTSTLLLSIETEFIFIIDDLVVSLGFLEKLIGTSLLDVKLPFLRKRVFFPSVR